MMHPMGHPLPPQNRRQGEGGGQDWASYDSCDRSTHQQKFQQKLLHLFLPLLLPLPLPLPPLLPQFYERDRTSEDAGHDPASINQLAQEVLGQWLG